MKYGNAEVEAICQSLYGGEITPVNTIGVDVRGAIVNGKKVNIECKNLSVNRPGLGGEETTKGLTSVTTMINRYAEHSDYFFIATARDGFLLLDREQFKAFAITRAVLDFKSSDRYDGGAPVLRLGKTPRTAHATQKILNFGWTIE